MEGLVRWGIELLWVYIFNQTTITKQTYMGKPAKYLIKVCFAQAKNVIWEIMHEFGGLSLAQSLANARAIIAELVSLKVA